MPGMNRRRIALHAGAVVLAAAITLALSHDARFLRAQLNADTLWQTSLIWDVLHRARRRADVPGLDEHEPRSRFRARPRIASGARFVALGRVRLRVPALHRLRVRRRLDRARDRRPAVARCVLYVEGIFGGLILLGTAIPTTWNEGHLLYPALFPIATLLIACTHSGAFCVALGIVGLLLWSLREPWRWRRAIVTYALTALIVVSDREVWLEFVIPVVAVAVAAVAFGFVRRDVRRFATFGGLGGAVFAGACTGGALLPLFNHAPDLPTPALADLIAQLPRFWNDALVFGRDNPNLIDGVLWLGLLALAFPVLLVRRPGPAAQNERAAAFLLYGAVAFAGAFAFCAALYQDFDSYRYIEPVLFLLVPTALPFSCGRAPRGSASAR